MKAQKEESLESNASAVCQLHNEKVVWMIISRYKKMNEYIHYGKNLEIKMQEEWKLKNG